MNERIKKLYEQAHIEHRQEYFSSVVDSTITSVSVTRHFNADLFAELIAADIAELCADIDGGENMFSRAIRKEYGVEE